MLEVFVGALMCIIVSSNDFPLRFPSFGSKLLVHRPSANAQRIHCDYSVMKDGVLAESEVKYFMIATAEKSSYLHVLPMGHLKISRRDGKVSNVASKLIELPPYSMGIFRGIFLMLDLELMMMLSDEESLGLHQGFIST